MIKSVVKDIVKGVAIGIGGAGGTGGAIVLPQRTLVDEPLAGDLSLRSDGTNDYILMGYTFPAFEDTDTVEFEVKGLSLRPVNNTKYSAGSKRNTAPIQRLISIARNVDKIDSYIDSNGVATIIVRTDDIAGTITSIKLDYNKTNVGKATMFINGIEAASTTNNALSTFVAIADIALFSSNQTGTLPTLPQGASIIDLREAKLTINNTVVAWLRADPAGYFVDTVRDVIKYNRGEGANTYPLTLVNTTTWAVGWTNNGNKFIFDTGTLNISGAGTYNTTYFEHKNYSSLDRVQNSVIVKFNDLTSILALYRKDPYSVPAGTFAKIDLTQNKLIFCEKWDGAAAPVDLLEQDIVQTVNDTDTYTVTLKKNDGKNWLILKNNTTLAEDVLYDSGIYADTANFIGLQWGKFGIAHLGGNITISDLKIETDFPDTPKYAIYGDSFVEGNSLVSSAGGYDARWCAKLRDHYNNDVLISGRGGALAAITLASLTQDLDLFSPENVIIQVGLNDSVFATWQTGIDAIIVKILARGATPIICTLTPRDDRQPFLNNANTYILGTLAANYQILDFAELLTVGGDRLTRIVSLFFDDDIHPNVAGHELMYNYCLTELT